MNIKNPVINIINQIQSEFIKMGGCIVKPTKLDRYMLAATYKSIRLSKAIIALIDNNHGDEAMIILRSLIEHSINMRWIIEKDTISRLNIYLKDLSNKNFGKTWSKVPLDKRMEEVGFNVRDYYDYCVKVTYSYAHINASSLRWKEVYPEAPFNEAEWTADAIYPIVQQMLGHVIKSLNLHFKDYFKMYDEIWNSIKVDHEIRKKVEDILSRKDLI